MKDAAPVIPAERHVDAEGFANRKLIRPSLNHSNHSGPSAGDRRERPERTQDRSNGGAPPRKTPPPEQTNAENFYFQKQMQSKTPMVIVLADGEEVHGIIEWYDRSCIQVNRIGAPNLMIYKSFIKYAYKEGENIRK